MDGGSSPSGSDAGEIEEEQGWGDWEEDKEEGSAFRSLFSGATFATLEEVLAHDAGQHGFDLRQYRSQHQLDQVGTIQLVNYLRAAVAAGQDALPALGSGARPWQDDAFLQPVLMDDELLFHDWEGDMEEEQRHQPPQQQAPAAVAGAGHSQAGSAAAAQQGEGSSTGLPSVQEVERLRHENEALRAALQAMQTVMLQDDTMRELLGEQAGGASSQAAASPAVSRRPGAASNDAALRIDGSYFDSYSTLDIHREMLADKARTQAYRDALELNPGLMRGAAVLDVGCGTGILSMFAARGGAAAVVGVDGSDAIAALARANVEANGLGSSVQVLAARVEALESLPLPEGRQQVDVLVSEWMGYALLFETMLDSVLHARDRFLRPGGAILPDVAQLYVAACGEGATGLGFWQDVYGFSMPAARDSLHEAALRRALVRPVAAADVLGAPQLVRSFDLATMAAADQDFTTDFRLEASGPAPQQCHALALWFDTLFTERFCKEHPVSLSTSPHAAQTHWVQTVLSLKEPVALAPAALGLPEAAVALCGKLSMARSRDTHRTLDIAVEYVAERADGSSSDPIALIYRMGVES